MAALASDIRPGRGVSLAAFVADEETATKLEQVATFHWPGAVITQGTTAHATSYLQSAPSPDLLLVDLGDSEQPFEDLQGLAELCSPSTQVVVLGTVNDLGLYKRLTSAGVADYLVKPLSADELESALLAAMFSQTSISDTAPSGKLAVTIGARGGVGASTIALNGAWLLAGEYGNRVALADLDVQFGTAALSLDLVPSSGMIETLRHPDRLDSLFMASALLPKTDKLSVLAAEEDVARETDFSQAGAERLIEELRNSFEWVWLDLPRTLCHVYANVLRDATYVHVVSDLTLAGMRDTMRIFNLVQNADGGEVEMGVIINHARPTKGMPLGEFSKGLSRPIIATMPDEPKVEQAATSGKPLAQVAPRSKFITELRKIVRQMTPEEKKASRGLFSRLKTKSG